MASNIFGPAPEPPTELGRVRVLSSTAGVRVSPLQLGAMSIGEAWRSAMGSMSKEQSFKLLDAFVEAGGNFIDTANNYQNEESETWIGEWMKERGNRDQLILATKYTTSYKSYELGKNSRSVNFQGNHRRSMHVSVRDSLRKLGTDWIDILYLHWWDWSSGIHEIMDALHILVQQGKVLYLGISDTPAWIVSAANEYATAHGKTPFSIYQGRWNIMVRDMERDIVPMCRRYGMAIAAWDVLGGGKFQTKKALEEREKAGEGMRDIMGDRSKGQTEDEQRVSSALEKVASEHGISSVTAIALAWILLKAPHVFPIIGGRKVEHLKDNIQALSIKLTAEQVKYLEEQCPLKPEFPGNFIGEDPAVTGQTPGMQLSAAPMSWVRGPKAIGVE